jgi:signal transduction histidine kinase
LVVAYNGKGFAISESKNGIGLVNMQTKAESLNETFELQSHPGRGCKIKVILPCLQ